MTQYRVPIVNSSGLTASNIVATDSNGDLTSIGDVGDFSSNQNLIINGGFNFFQRTTPGTLTSVSDNTYGPDRWKVMTQTTSVQIKRVTDLLGVPFKYSCQLKQNQSSAQRMGLLQIIESCQSMSCRSKPITAQVRIKCSSSQPIRIALLEWTYLPDTTLPDFVNDWTSSTYTTSNFFTSANTTVVGVDSVTPTADTWTSLTLTGDVSSSCANLILFIWTEGTAAQDVTLDISECDVHFGSYVRNWSPMNEAIELQMCQRYYEKSYPIDTAVGSASSPGQFASPVMNTALSYVWTIYYLQNKRTAVNPVIYSTYDGASGYLNEVDINGTHVANRAVSISAAGTRTANWYTNNMSVGNYVLLQWSVDAEI